MAKAPVTPRHGAVHAGAHPVLLVPLQLLVPLALGDVDGDGVLDAVTTNKRSASTGRGTEVRWMPSAYPPYASPSNLRNL